MAVEDEKNEALEEVSDIEDEEEDIPSSKKPPNKLIIGILSLVIFFALFLFFGGEKELPQQVVENPSITTPELEKPVVIPLPREEAFEGAVVEKPSVEPSAGEILILSDDRDIDAVAPNEAPAVS